MLSSPLTTLSAQFLFYAKARCAYRVPQFGTGPMAQGHGPRIQLPHRVIDRRQHRDPQSTIERPRLARASPMLMILGGAL